jgi:hypothetical protein
MAQGFLRRRRELLRARHKQKHFQEFARAGETVIAIKTPSATRGL